MQEDASTILSFASPYNVQLELIDGKGTLPLTMAQQINQHSLTHPLYRSSSQEDLNTIERNARKKLYSGDESSYPTLKMDQQPRSPAARLPAAHEEHEKSNSLKKIQHFIDMVEEKFQTKYSSSSSSPRDDSKKSGRKFGIRVLPPCIGDLETSSSPSKAQADNENNTNMEWVDTADSGRQAMANTSTPVAATPQPEATKRTKHNKTEMPTKPVDEVRIEFVRQLSINSSGIKRDAAGIPQEIPSEMLQAALSARENRKGTGTADRKAKGQAPCPPPYGDQQQPNDAAISSFSADVPDAANTQSQFSDISLEEQLNFTDNFDNGFDKSQPNDDALGTGARTGSIPKIARQENGNNIEGGMVRNQGTQAIFQQTHNPVILPFPSIRFLSFPDYSTVTNNFVGEHAKQIELNSKHITVHQISQEDDGEERRTSSLCDLSNLEHTNANGNQSNSGTLERAQSLEMSGGAAQAAKVTPKKRKITLTDQAEECELKETLEPLQKSRLKSAYEWGNLEDAIYDGIGAEGNAVEAKPQTDMMAEVLAAADKFDREVNDIELNKVIADDDMISKDDAKPRDVMEIAWQPITINRQTIDVTQRFMDAEIENSKCNVGPSASRSPTGNSEKDISCHIGGSESDPVKTPRRPFDGIDSPKSEVLKKLLSHSNASPEIIENIGKVSDGSPTMETLSNERPKIETATAAETNNSESQETDMSDSEIDSTESNQTSPIFSCNGQGVNNISITPFDSNVVSGHTLNGQLDPPEEDETSARAVDESQPSSIALSDDKEINFTLSTADESGAADDRSLSPSSKDEVIIIESLSSKKAMETSQSPAGESRSIVVNEHQADTNDASKSFITEIMLTNATENDQRMNAKNLSKTHAVKSTDKLSKASSLTSVDSTAAHSVTSNGSDDKHVLDQEEYIPRNAEIRFTTSTYQSPQRQLEKRHSHIDQIRSNFERQHTSEIPVPIRKLNTPSTPPASHSSSASPQARTSPSKIPVFNSQKSSDNLLKNCGPNRASVSITSIKNSSRNPSGK